MTEGASASNTHNTLIMTSFSNGLAAYLQCSA
jgi:hypothetical protein